MTPISFPQIRISLARRRVAAKLVDAALAGVVGVGLWLMSFDDWVLVGPLAAFFVYQTISHWLFSTTFGKSLFGLRIYKANASRPGFLRCALRSFVEFVSPVVVTVASVIVLIGLANISRSTALSLLVIGAIVVAGYGSWLIAVVTDLTVMLRREDSRSLHDLVAGTSVSFAHQREPEALPADVPVVDRGWETAPAWRRLAARTLDVVGCSGILVVFGVATPGEVQFVAWIMVGIAYPVVTQWVYGQTLGKALLGIAVVHHAGGSLSVWRSLWRWLVEFVPIALVGVGTFILSLKWMANAWSDDAASAEMGGLFLAMVALGYAFVLGAFAVVLASALDSLVAFTSAPRRTFHDILAGTRVVLHRRQTKTSPADPVAVVSGMPLGPWA